MPVVIEPTGTVRHVGRLERIPLRSVAAVRRLTRAERAAMRWAEAMDRDSIALDLEPSGRAGVPPWAGEVAS